MDLRVPPRTPGNRNGTGSMAIINPLKQGVKNGVGATVMRRLKVRQKNNSVNGTGLRVTV